MDKYPPPTIKPRLLKCKYCGYEEINALAAPKCPACSNDMITIIKSIITGERM